MKEEKQDEQEEEEGVSVFWTNQRPRMNGRGFPLGLVLRCFFAQFSREFFRFLATGPRRPAGGGGGGGGEEEKKEEKKKKNEEEE